LAHRLGDTGLGQGVVTGDKLVGVTSTIRLSVPLAMFSPPLLLRDQTCEQIRRDVELTDPFLIAGEAEEISCSGDIYPDRGGPWKFTR
jgi:hypothetical protein